MKQIFLIGLFVGGAACKLFCQVSFSDFSAVHLPESIKKDASAVYRLDEGFLEIFPAAKYSFKTHQVITLLNRNAEHHLHQSLLYNKFRKIENVLFKIYNAAGDLVRTYQKKDFSSRDYTDEISLYTDDKLLYLDAAPPGYPCTVEMICEQKATGYVELPNWIITNPGEAVEYSFFKVKAPLISGIKYRVRNIELEPALETTADGKIYTWMVKNINASKPEDHTYTSANLPQIEIVPEMFEYEGYKGEFKSWRTFGAWNYQFYEDPRPFDKDDVRRIEDLVSGCKTEREKIKVLYTWLQKNMRYVSIQLGIGGFKPFPVKYVNDNKYGDCKALTNYMRYMLKTVGIKAYPALVNAGYNKVPADIDFPSDPFNHVILCVPLEKDSVWLECTSNNNEYGFLGNFTENKNALLLTEKGGVLVATPKSDYANNVLSSKTIITLDADGASAVRSDIFCTGDFWDLFYQIMQQNGDQRKNIFINYLHYKIPEQFEINAKPDSVHGKCFRLMLSYDQQYDFRTGDKLFFRQRLNTLISEDIKRVGARQSDYVFAFPYNKTDSTTYVLAAGMIADALPAKRELANEYCSYRNEYFKKEGENTITVVANLILKKQVVPPADYSKVADFFQQVNRVENERFIVRLSEDK